MATPPLLIFSDDWGRHPSSAQHLVRQLLADTSVTWVNLIGMRRPRLDATTVRRGVQKLGDWLRPAEPIASGPVNLRVVSPRMWPGFKYAWERSLNRRWLLRQMHRVLAELPRPPIAVTTQPTLSVLVGRLPVERWVYYQVDDFAAWPGLDGPTLAELDHDMVRRADHVIVVSEELARKAGRDVQLLTHGVDLDFWKSATPPRRPAHALFWGLIDKRTDAAFVRAAADVLPVRLVGPIDDPPPGLFDIPNVEHRPAVPLEQLPAMAAGAAVLLLPYADSTVTRMLQPLKLKEYLATGRPVVSRDLPAVREWADALDLADTPRTFAAAVRARATGELPDSQRTARERLRAESWSAKAAAFRRFVFKDRPE